MPRQDSKRGLGITLSNFEQAFETHTTRYGVKGLNVADALDALEANEFSRMLNVTHRQDMGMTSRPGQTSIATSSFGSEIHTIKRLNDPYTREVLSGATFTRVVGVNGHLAIGTTGALTQIDTGYTGDPLWMVPYRPPNSAQTWMFVADRSRMRKVRVDGLDLPIGLPKPVAVPTAALAAENKTVIANFTNDGSEFSNWVPNAGKTYDSNHVISGTSTNVPFASAVTDPNLNGGVNFETTEPNRAYGYFAYWNLAKTMDLSLVGSVDSSDDDYIHLWLNFSHPNLIKEFRIYFVCSAAFSTTILPGTPDVSGANGDAYLKAFSGNDFADFVRGQDAQVESAETSRLRTLRDQELAANNAIYQGIDEVRRESYGPLFGERDQSRTITQQSPSAADRWGEYGIVGVPVRRGDFQRIGSTAGRDWGTITGIVCFVQTADNTQAVAVRLSDLYMTGGSGPDTGNAEFSKYDWRYTNYDPRTGAEGNPCDIMSDVNHLDTLRRGITITPTAYGDAAIRQRVYRRGGSLPTDWQFLGVNTSDGGAFLDEVSDNEAAASSSLEIDNFQPIPTAAADGSTVLAQPVPSMWGPLEDFLFACGDPYRPGHVYFCKRGRPDSWPDDYTTEVCSPSEELMAGVMFGGQSFVFSQERLFVLYPNLSGEDATVTAAPTQCKKGMVNRHGVAVGIGGIYFVNRDGIYRTVGGPEEWLSKKIDPLFRGKTVNGMLPISFATTTHVKSLRLEIHENELYFQYTDTNSVRQCLVYNIPFGFWKPYTFGQATGCFYSDEGNSTSTLLMGSLSASKVYSHTGFSDDGTAISCVIRTGVLSYGRPREEKLLGDQIIDLDSQGVNIDLINRLNDEQTTNPTSDVNAATGRRRAILDGFGVIPQRVRNLSTELLWSSSTAAPVVYQLGTAVIPEPDITINRVTQWDDLNHPDEGYLTGVTFDCDTGGEDRTIIIEYDFNGVINTAATLTVNCNGRHKIKFSWTAVQAHKVRIRPNDDCQMWILYKLDWISLPEPPRIARWDIHFENGWDQYYTGLDLYCDTNGQTKTIEVYVDGTLVKTETVTTTGRRVHHITLPWGRGHVFRFVATDDNPGLLYEYRWHLDAEPSEQTNWNQNFTVAGTEADKYLKAIVFQCDTFGVTKTVTVECDGVVVETLAINSNGRKVVQKAFPQHLGRVFRVYPTDGNPGRLYSLWWVFDQEPLALDRWETQEITHGFDAWHYPIYAHLGLKSTTKVTLTVRAYNQEGMLTERQYDIDPTEGEKRKVFVGLKPTKGILYKYILTSVDPFWLYREETVVAVREWGTDKTLMAHVFGNDDTDQTRQMAKSELAAARGGGTAI